MTYPQSFDKLLKLFFHKAKIAIETWSIIIIIFQSFKFPFIHFILSLKLDVLLKFSSFIHLKNINIYTMSQVLWQTLYKGQIRNRLKRIPTLVGK